MMKSKQTDIQAQSVERKSTKKMLSGSEKVEENFYLFIYILQDGTSINLSKQKLNLKLFFLVLSCSNSEAVAAPAAAGRENWQIFLFYLFARSSLRTALHKLDTLIVLYSLLIFFTVL